MVLVLMAIALMLGAGAGPTDPRALRGEITSLRSAGRYADALDRAEHLSDALQQDAATPAYQLQDAARLRATLALILTLPDSAQARLAEADSMTSAVRAAAGQGRYDRCAELLARQRLLRARFLGARHPETVQSMGDLGSFLSALGHYAEAESLHRTALQLGREQLGTDHPRVAGRARNLGQALQEQGQYRTAESAFREALEIRRRVYGAEHRRVAESYNDLATLYWNRGNFARAEPLLRRGLAINLESRGRQDPHTFVMIHNLSLLLRDQGAYAEAESLLRENLELRRALLSPEDPRLANTLGDLAMLRLCMDQPTAAEPLLEEALSIHRSRLPAHHPDIIQCLCTLSEVLCDTDRIPEAESKALEALSLLPDADGRDHPLAAPVLQSLGSIRAAQSRLVEADSLLASALELHRDLRGPDHPAVAGCLQELAATRLRARRTVAAESTFAEAAAVFERARLRVRTGFTRSAFVTSPYWHLAAVRLHLGQTASAWTAAERALGRSLAELLLHANSRSLTAEEAARVDSLRGSLQYLNRRLAALERAAAGDSAANAVRARLLEQEAEWCDIQQALSRQDPVGEGFPFSRERIQRALRPDQAVLGWLHVDFRPGQSECWGYVIRSTGPVRWVRLGEAAAPAAARGFCSALRSATSWGAAGLPVGRIHRQARRVCGDWFDPILPHLDGVQSVVVVPSGPMLGVPLEALMDDAGRPLLDRFTISYAPSASLYAWLREQSSGGGERADRALLAGDPLFPDDRPSFPRLPGTRREVELIAQLLPDAEILLGSRADERELDRMARTGELGNFRILHLATHALVDDRHPERSRLIWSQAGLPDPVEAAMAGTPIFDGCLSAAEVAAQWEIDADLVVLSGCQTGLGQEMVGEGYLGLAQAFLRAGARSLLVSLWKVDDEQATPRLMERFYANLLDGPMPRARALREAKRWLRDYTDEEGGHPYEHPAYWSGFILLGDPGMR